MSRRNCSNSTKAFFALLRAGLWVDANENDNLNEYFVDGLAVNWADVIRLSEEQTVVGLVTVGLEKIPNGIVPLTVKLTLLGKCQLIEQQNVSMNHFVADLLQKMSEADTNTVLVKGQGIAQCYERPLWRSSGDIDLLVDISFYDNAKAVISVLSSSGFKENRKSLEYCVSIGSWPVEIHGTLHCRLTKRLDAFLDTIQKECCIHGNVRIWNNGGKYINLPSVDNDIFVVFTHLIKHFFREGVGLRQCCDWCRLMWTFRSEIDVDLLELRLRKAGIMSEWKVFSAFAVDWLGTPVEALPFYSNSSRYHRKARKVKAYILNTGSFGNKRDKDYYYKYSFIVRKTISFFLHTRDSFQHFFVFPMDSILIWFGMISNGVYEAMHNK